jgi:predicted PurR-regulated permease PerM
VKTSGTFLNLNALADDVLRRLSGSSLFANWLTRIAVFAALIALLLALYAILVPVAYGVSSEFMSRKEDVQNMQREVDQLKNRQEELQEQQKELGFKIDHFSH